MNKIFLDFECLKHIDHVMFYSGVQWYACISVSLRPFLNQSMSNILSDHQIKVMPLYKGIFEYHKGDIASILFIYPDSIQSAIESWLYHIQTSMHKCKNISAQFVINESVKLKSYNRIDDHSLLNEKTTINILSDTQGDEEISQIDEFRLCFISPLRLKRPDKDKTKGHKFFDTNYFDLETFINALSLKCHSCLTFDHQFEITDKQFVWVDMSYQKSLGGIIGSIILKGVFSHDIRKLLEEGQYIGIGKNSSFGFGQYRLKNYDSFDNQYCDHKTLFSDLIRYEYLENVLNEMDSDSIDFDGINLSDVLLNKKSYLNRLIEKLSQNNYLPSEHETFYKKKKNGQYRTISVYNFTDRFIFKNLSKLISESCDRLMGDESFAYRKGYGYHKAVQYSTEMLKSNYKYGIKADIQTFFDSIPLLQVFLLMDAFYYYDPILKLLHLIYPETQIGLNQGNALSPLLSNIYMISFDQGFKKSPYVLIRFADDFLLLSKTKDELMLNYVDDQLKKLKLNLSIEKCVRIEPDQSFEFLGHIIKNGEAKAIKEFENTDPSWSHLFDKHRMDGIPVYLSYFNSYAHSEGEALVIEVDAVKRKISWKEIQRLVIIGKPRVSASVIKKALDYNKSIVFVNIMGNPIGSLHRMQKWINLQELVERRGNDYQKFSLNFIQSIVKSKIHNQKIMLQKRGVKSDLLKDLEESIDHLYDIDALRGKEGAASVEYFKHIREFVNPFPFEKREYYPPVGPVNAMLSLGYTLLYNRICEALMSKGFYPYDGIFHVGKGSHKALASDMMEPFRFIPERVILHLIHNKQIELDDFVDFQTYRGDCTRLKSEGFRKYINRFEWSMNQIIKQNDKVMTYYGVINESISNLYNSIVLGVEYQAFKLRM